MKLKLITLLILITSLSFSQTGVIRDNLVGTVGDGLINGVENGFSTPVPKTNLIGYWSASRDGIKTGDTILLKNVSGVVTGKIKITGRDWTTSYIPLKTAATLQWVGTPTIDTAFWKHDIYPTTAFSDVDYNHKTFINVQSHVLNLDSTEYLPARIIEIAVYSQALTGSDLAVMNFRNNVPALSGTELWVDKNYTGGGNNGTAAHPYTTLTAANTINKTIIVKSGNYTEAGVMYFAGGQTWNFVSYNTVTVAGTVFATSASANNTIKGAVINQKSGQKGIYFISGNNNTVSNCVINASSNGGKNLQILDGTGIVASKCVFLNSSNSNSVDFRKVGMTLTECYFGGSSSVEVITPNTTTLTTTSVLSYNRFKNTMASAKSAFYIQVGGNYDIKYNSFATLGGRDLLETSNAALTGAIRFTGNNITSSGLESGCFYLQFPAVQFNCNIFSNRFVITSGTLTAGIIALIGQDAPKVNRNYIDLNVKADAISINSTTVKNPVQIDYNTLMLRKDGGHIILGSDVSAGNTTYDSKYDGSEIIGNTLYGLWYFHPDTSATNTGHGISIFSQLNCKVKYNYCNGTNHIVVIKASDRTPAMVNTDCIVSYNVGINNDGSLFPKTMSGIKFFNNVTYADNDKIVTVAGGIYDLGSTGPAINNTYENNIFFDNTPANATRTLIRFDPVTSLGGLLSDHNLLYSAHNLIATVIDANTPPYTFKYTFAQWQALGYDANSLNVNPNFTSPTQLWPVTPFTGVDLGSTYNTGLDISTSWPTIVTKQQGATWQIGAYVK